MENIGITEDQYDACVIIEHLRSIMMLVEWRSPEALLIVVKAARIRLKSLNEGDTNKSEFVEAFIKFVEAQYFSTENET